MTEDEARKKVCKREWVHTICGDTIECISNCIASDCMMWITDLEKMENAGCVLSEENRIEFSKVGDCGLKG